jgi:hypothetical protein
MIVRGMGRRDCFIPLTTIPLTARSFSMIRPPFGCDFATPHDILNKPVYRSFGRSQAKAGFDRA